MNMEKLEQEAVRVLPLVRSKVPIDDVHDVMQDIRLALLTALPHHRGEAAVSNYAYAIAKNKVTDYWRREFRRKKIQAAAVENYCNLPEISIVREPKRSDWDSMTPAEKDVFRLIGMGLDNTEIAQVRFTSLDTVRTHVKAVYKKLGCRDRVKVALMSNKIFMEDDNGDKD